MARQAQGWAQQMLSAFDTWERGRASRGEFPVDLPAELFDGGGIMARGQAIRLCQEVNLAIKQHNETEERLLANTWEAQKAEARRNRAGTVTIPDYVPQRIMWILKQRLIDPRRPPEQCPPDYIPRCQIYLGHRELRGPSKQSELAKLANSFFMKVGPVETTQPKDRLERFVHQDEPEPASEEGIDRQEAAFNKWFAGAGHMHTPSPTPSEDMHNPPAPGAPPDEQSPTTD